MWTSKRSTAAALDHADALASLRTRYDIRPGVIHLDGSGVGTLTGGSPTRLRRFIEHRWDAGSSHPSIDHDWRPQAQRTARGLAPLIGARPEDVTITDSVSMNLFRSLLAAARLRPQRRVMLIGRDCFPGDRCIARSAAEVTGKELVVLDRPADLPEKLDENVAVVALSHVDPVDGAVRDAASITGRLHRHGALALWELSHSAGALRVDLREWQADFAIGCGYKYLGGGPGAPSYCYIAGEHHPALRASSAADGEGAGALDPLGAGFSGAPPKLSISAFGDGLSVLDGVSARELESKTSALVELFLSRVRERCPEVEILEPPARTRRGTQVALRHPRAQHLADSLYLRGIFVDFLEPDVLRFGFAPAWLRYVDAWEAAEGLREALIELASG